MGGRGLRNEGRGSQRRPTVVIYTPEVVSGGVHVSGQAAWVHFPAGLKGHVSHPEPAPGGFVGAVDTVLAGGFGPDEDRGIRPGSGHAASGSQEGRIVDGAEGVANLAQGFGDAAERLEIRDTGGNV